MTIIRPNSKLVGDILFAPMNPNLKDFYLHYGEVASLLLKAGIDILDKNILDDSKPITKEMVKPIIDKLVSFLYNTENRDLYRVSGYSNMVKFLEWLKKCDGISNMIKNPPRPPLTKLSK
jgi:hypothetical protein